MAAYAHKLLSLLATAFIIAFISTASALDTSILNSFKSKDSINIIVSFKGNNVRSIRSQVATQQHTSRTERATALYTSLKQHADATQGNVLRKLRTSLAENTRVKQLWISNQLVIKHASQKLVENLLQMNEVSAISEETFVKLNEPVSKTVEAKGTPAESPWGVGAIQAPEVWATGTNGTGVVVANIDTGVLHTHEALKDNYRNLHGWYDPVKESPTPYDDHSHGTHVMGTAVGRANGIGVAPGATWIACKGCTFDGECSRIDLLLCGQWVTCPDAGEANPQCSTPNVVSNSWVEDRGSDWYDDVVSSWLVVGITPIFGMGNDGPECGSVRSPADSSIAFGVGAYNSSNYMASFSSVGPTARGSTIKPNAVAPGVAILSAHNSGVNAYATFSGTSMATPHVAGVVALLYSKKPSLSALHVPDVLVAGAGSVMPSGRNCGGIDETVYPNHHAGAGKISALAAFARLDSLMADRS